MRSLTTWLVATGWLLAACSGSGGSEQQGAPSAVASSQGSADAPSSATCVSRVDGYAVDHPPEWSSSSASEREPCRVFHPEPIPSAQGWDPWAAAIRLDLVPQALDEVERLERAAADVLSSERPTGTALPAVRQELRAAEDGALPRGTRTLQWLVDLGRRTLIARTSEQAQAGSYEDNVRVLDAMMRSLRPVQPEPGECSAQDLPAEPEAQPGLPAAVQEMRRQVYRAAVRCDFDRLEELLPADGFTYSFGGGDDPVGSWRRAELSQEEPQPMRYLAGLLQRPYGSRDVQGRTQYEWPSAFGYDSWAAVPEQDRQALAPLYDEEDQESFEQFGAYVGYRVILTQDGTWTAFVAGD